MVYEYIGSFKELPKEAKYGSTCYYTTHTTITITHITYPTNCKNCGAILHNHICEYCGSDNKE